MDWIALDARAKGVILNDFSHKAKQPEIPVLESAADVVQCVATLHELADMVFEGPLVRTLDKLYRFLKSEKNKWRALGPGAVTSLVRWVNNRLFAVRVAVTHNTDTAWARVVGSFSVYGSEYCDSMNAFNIGRLVSLENRFGGGGSTSGASGGSGYPSNKQKFDKAKRADFAALLKEVPKHDGKNICFHHMSAKGCTVGASGCLAKGRVHVDHTLTAKAKAAFLKAIGPLRDDIA